MCSLPDRQLRNIALALGGFRRGSLPDRQLRNVVAKTAEELRCSLPDRQLRKEANRQFNCRDVHCRIGSLEIQG